MVLWGECQEADEQSYICRRKEVKDTADELFQEFIVRSSIRINRYLNAILWYFTAIGPAFAVGVKAGIFPGMKYVTCLCISILVALLALIHGMMLKRYPNQISASVFAITALDALIVYMMLSHVNIRLIWFLVPLLSILFCDKRLYGYALVLNYVFLCASVWETAPYYVNLRADYGNTGSYFCHVMGGYTIELLIMAAAGYIILKLVLDHYMELLRQYEVIREKEASELEKMNILDSMAEIYDNVNLISFKDNTEMSLRDSNQQKHGIDMNSQTHTLMNQRLKNQIHEDHLEAFLSFTNITTVRDRMLNRKIISGDFADVNSVWFRAQYITVEQGSDGKPDMVIYTTRNVDEEKRREEHLIRLSMTDELTGLHNRRRYEEDLNTCRTNGPEKELVLFSVDVNGLKKLNDTKGHLAGDELIRAAAECLVNSVRSRGTAYRTGGDEFMAIVYTEMPEKLREEIVEKASQWHGTYVEELSMAVGYGAYSDHPGATVSELEHIADTDMYHEKEMYYRDNEIERRVH